MCSCTLRTTEMLFTNSGVDSCRSFVFALSSQISGDTVPTNDIIHCGNGHRSVIAHFRFPCVEKNTESPQTNKIHETICISGKTEKSQAIQKYRTSEDMVAHEEADLLQRQHTTTTTTAATNEETEIPYQQHTTTTATHRDEKTGEAEQQQQHMTTTKTQRGLGW